MISQKKIERITKIANERITVEYPLLRHSIKEWMVKIILEVSEGQCKKTV